LELSAHLLPLGKEIELEIGLVMMVNELIRSDPLEEASIKIPKGGLRVWLKLYSTCLANTRL
jgi:hypothetical protein